MGDPVNYEISDGGEPIALQLQAPLHLDADRKLLWRVFENLLRNAMIHSGGHGLGLAIAASAVRRHDGRI